MRCKSNDIEICEDVIIIIEMWVNRMRVIQYLSTATPATGWGLKMNNWEIIKLSTRFGQFIIWSNGKTDNISEK